MNTSAIYGFTNTLDEVLRREKPTHIAVVFDPLGGTFRDNLYPNYKANRSATPEDIKIAVPYIKQIIEGFQIPIVEVLGFEADDTIGTLAKKAEVAGFQVYMMTPDKDYCQLVSENIFIYKPKRSGNDAEIWGVPEVQKEFQVKNPLHVIDILGLWGDSVDNVPGAPGIGEKGAKELVSHFGEIENMYANLNQLKTKHKEILKNNKDLIMLSKALVTIEINVPVEFDEEFYRYKDLNINLLKPIFDELEFRTLAARILKSNQETQISTPQPQIAENPQVVEYQSKPNELNLFSTPQIPAPQKTVEQNLFETVVTVNQTFNTIKTVPHQYYFIDKEELRQELISKLSDCDEFCFDTETTGLDVLTDELVGMSFSIKPHEAYFVAVPQNQNEALKIVSEFKHVFENENICKIGQNMKFDIAMLKSYGVEVRGTLWDTMLAHYLVDPDTRHNLNALAENYLKYSPVPIEDLIGKGKTQINMRSVKNEVITEYAGEDADVTLQLKYLFEKELNLRKLSELFETIEMPLVSVLEDMEREGISLDVNALHDLSKELKADLELLEKDIWKIAGYEFNVASPKQLGEILFERLKVIPNPKMTKTKQYATGEEELSKLVDKHPIISKILDHRTLSKLISTYVDALPEMLHRKTKRVHTSFNQAVAATGRLSSNNPNLQNIPIRTERGREIRKAFVPRYADYVLISADYSQIELRLIAHMSHDKNMIAAFQNGEDIHAATAAKVFNVDIQEVTKEMRSKAKGANFGIIYGISAFGLAENLHISRAEAKELIDNYFRTYPKVKEYMDNNIRFAREMGYVSTLYGRRRYLKDINSSNAMVRGFAERNAINAPVQGTAADVIKIAMINIFNAFRKNNIKSKMILQVHDELVFDVLRSELEQVKEIVEYEMEHVAELSVPLSVEIGVGENWLSAH